ncbi:hypothetical protein IKF94_01570 [Candidatus Saccharibacteria bacterium]|nr:hypothetical protein [Candidatus Saccharibacteria bacterium]
MSETLKNNSEAVGKETNDTAWDGLKNQPFAGDKTESTFWANELEATSKQFEDSKKEFEKKNLLEKIKAKITGNAPNKTEHEAEMTHDTIKFQEAAERENIEAGVSEEEMFPDREANVDKAYEMAKASDKYETEAAKQMREAEAGYGDMSAKQYLNKVDKADKAREKAGVAAEKAAEQYDNNNRVEFENGMEVQ